MAAEFATLAQAQADVERDDAAFAAALRAGWMGQAGQSCERDGVTGKVHRGQREHLSLFDHCGCVDDRFTHRAPVGAIVFI